MPAITRHRIWLCIRTENKRFPRQFPKTRLCFAPIHLDNRYNFRYTLVMKTAISIPDDLFAQAEQFARERGLSRSQLYAHALQVYLRSQRYVGITEALDQLYGSENSTLDPAIQQAQQRSLDQDAW